MYPAQKTPATAASRTPTVSRCVLPSVLTSSRIPDSASSTHSASSHRRDRIAASASGPTNSTVTAMPSGMRASDR